MSRDAVVVCCLHLTLFGCSVVVDSNNIAGAPRDAGTSPDVGTSTDAGIRNPDAGSRDSTEFPKAGNPSGSCSQPLPPEAQPMDTSHPTTVVGSGNSASCTFQKVASALATGGVVTFNCGPEVVTIPIAATLELPTDRSTVIDGGNKIILDGGGNVRILRWNHDNYQVNNNVLTLQHIALVNGKATGTEQIPTRPEPCSQGYNDGEGGALYIHDGILHVVDAVFMNNRAAELGPDTGGGAIYVVGSKPAYIAHSTFRGNRASNAGAIGSLQTGNFIYNSLFEENNALGHGANSDDPTKCSFINNDQHEVGSGGNGGAIYNDGLYVSVTICGTLVRNNASNEFGAAVFFTSNDPSNRGTLEIRDSTMYGNASPQGWQWKPGISTNAKTVEPVNSDTRP